MIDPSSATGVAGDALVDAIEYRRYCALLGWLPDDRLTLPQWLTTPLIATTAARNKLRRWAERSPQPWPAAEPVDFLPRLDFIGDPLLSHMLARLLAGLPPPVSAYAVDRVQFLGAGITVLGWCGPVARTSRPWQIVVSATPDEDGADQFRDLAGHEIGHAWLLDEPAPDVRPASALWMSIVHKTPLDDVPMSALASVQKERTLDRQYELEVLRLTRAWGLRDLGSQAERSA